MKTVPRTMLFGVALTAVATLLFEVSLTRIFAVTLWYYFGFVAISLALMGTAIAAILCFLSPERFLGEEYRRYLGIFSLSFALSVPIAITLHLNTHLPHYSTAPFQFFFILALQLIPLIFTFFAAGMCITISLCRYVQQVDRVYFIDLVGASLGSMMVVPLLYHFSALAIVFLVSAIAALAGVLFTFRSDNRQVATMLKCVVLAALALFVLNDKVGILTVSAVKSYSTKAFQYNEPPKVFEKWSPVARVVVHAPVVEHGREYMKVTNDAGAPTRFHKFDGDYSKVDFVQRDSREIVNKLRNNASMLIIGSGGGMDVLAALYFNQKKITAVEINPVTASLVKGRFADYIGHIFDDPRVTLHVQEGRNFTAGLKEKFDVVQITMIDSWAGAAAGAYLFNENSLYTKEAIRDYVRCLNDTGVLSITRYANWNEGVRLLNMMLEQQENMNHLNAQDRTIVILEQPRMFRRATILLGMQPFTREEVEKVMRVVSQNKDSISYAPYVEEKHLNQTSFSKDIRSLIKAYQNGAQARAKFVHDYPYNIALLMPYDYVTPWLPSENVTLGRKKSRKCRKRH